MRLTKSQKEEFIVKVMKDVPRDKLNGLLKQAEQLVIEDALNDAPETIKNAWADPEANPWLSHGHCHTPGRLPILFGVAPSSSGSWRVLSPAYVHKLSAVAEEYGAEEDRLHALEAGLRGVVASVTTRDALLKALPEFEKYLPPEVGNDRSVPVISNLVASFVEAGWPKS